MSAQEWHFTPDDVRQAVALAHELMEAWAQWREPFYEGPWEHLGDAERDARVLVRGLLAAQELIQHDARPEPQILGSGATDFQQCDDCAWDICGQAKACLRRKCRT